jgi:hypothetical protein
MPKAKVIFFIRLILPFCMLYRQVGFASGLPLAVGSRDQDGQFSIGCHKEQNSFIAPGVRPIYRRSGHESVAAAHSGDRLVTGTSAGAILVTPVESAKLSAVYRRRRGDSSSKQI